MHFNVHFLLHVFFANGLLLAVYFICVLDYRNDVSQKAISNDVANTFNMVSVDGDTSTNDMLVLLRQDSILI